MTIKFDLRPLQVIAASRKGVDLRRTMALILIAAFLFLSGLVFTVGIYLYFSMRSDMEQSTAQLSTLNSQNDRMEKELKSLRDEMAFYDRVMNLISGDLPALECLGALEAALPEGQEIWISRIDITPGKTHLSGYAASERQVIDFARGLSSASVVSTVKLPVTSTEEKGNRSRVKFDIDCDLKTLGELTSSTAEASVPQVGSMSPLVKEGGGK